MTTRPAAGADAVTSERWHRRSDVSNENMAEADLIGAVRAGDNDAYGELYRRHHDSVQRLARHLCNGAHEADDVASDVFCNTLRAIRAGNGPRDDCCAYLLRSVRHTVIKRRTRQDTGRATPCPSDELDRQGLDDVSIAGGPATDAFHDVTDRFQHLLWFVEVEGHDSADVAAMEQIAAPAASSMLYRARRSLRRSYLRGCVRTPVHDDACHPVRSLLPAFVDGDVATPGATRVRRHLATCTACNQALGEMSAVYDRIGNRGIFALLPGVLRLLALDTAQTVVSAIPGTTALVAATITVGAVALPASDDRSSDVSEVSGPRPAIVDDVPPGDASLPSQRIPETGPPDTSAARRRPSVLIPVDVPVDQEPKKTTSVPGESEVVVPVVSVAVSDLPVTTVRRDDIWPGDTGGAVGGPMDPVVPAPVGEVTGGLAATANSTVTTVVGVVADVISGVDGIVEGAPPAIVEGAAGVIVDDGGIVDQLGGLVPIIEPVADPLDGLGGLGTGRGFGPGRGSGP